MITQFNAATAPLCGSNDETVAWLPALVPPFNVNARPSPMTSPPTPSILGGPGSLSTFTFACSQFS